MAAATGFATSLSSTNCNSSSKINSKIDFCSNAHRIRNSCSVACFPLEVSGDTRPSGVVNPPPMVPSVVQVIGTFEKRKRGRPPKGTVSMKPPPPKRIKKQEKAVEEEDEEENFCFVCLDGGSLVLCDRKGCPKVYHASCVKRDDVFFKSKAKWNCGWHICTVCLKASYYMCYTCPYSLCKGCSKDADYLRVRGSKGFCNTCMKIIMLIENKD